MAAASRRVRLERRIAPEARDFQLPGFVSGVIAPFLTTFVAWTLEQAKRTGLSKLYFVARDGEILFKIARVLAQKSDGPKIRYLYGSRKAWLLPSVRPDDPTSWDLFLRASRADTPRALLEALGIQAGGLDDRFQTEVIADDQVDRRFSESEAIRFVRQLLAHPRTSALVRSRIAQARSVAGQYLQQEGLLDDDRWAIVDVGWRLHCQAALKQIMGAISAALVEPIGLYLALARGHLPNEVSGRAFAMITDISTIFSRRAAVIENCFTPGTEPPLIGYQWIGSTAKPVFGEETRAEAEMQYVHCLHEAVVRYAEVMVEDGRLWDRMDHARENAIRAASDFISRPSSDEAAVFAAHRATSQIGHARNSRSQICKPLNIAELSEFMRAALLGKSLSRPACWWLEGSAALSSVPVRVVARTMLAIDEWRNRFGN